MTAAREMPDIGATGLMTTASSIRDTSGPPAGVRIGRRANRGGNDKGVAAVSPTRAPVHCQRRLYRSLAGHAGQGDVVERDRLLGSICQHRRAGFLDGVVARVRPVEGGVELVRLHLDQEAAVYPDQPEHYQRQRPRAPQPDGAGVIGRLGRPGTEPLGMLEVAPPQRNGPRSPRTWRSAKVSSGPPRRAARPGSPP